MVSNLQYGNFSIAGRVFLRSESLDCKTFLHFPIKNLTLLVSFTTMEVHTVGMIERDLNGKE